MVSSRFPEASHLRDRSPGSAIVSKRRRFVVALCRWGRAHGWWSNVLRHVRVCASRVAGSVTCSCAVCVYGERPAASCRRWILDAVFSARAAIAEVRVFFGRLPFEVLVSGWWRRGDSRAAAAAARTAEVSPPGLPNLSGRWAYSSFLIAGASSRRGGPQHPQLLSLLRVCSVV